MGKLSFHYGPMNSGKSSNLLQMVHSYEEKDLKVFVVKPSIDTKGLDLITSRTGLEKKVDYLVSPDDSFTSYFDYWVDNVSCVFVDEAQFLTKKQVEELSYFSDIYNIPVECYGIRTDFLGNLFEGSAALFARADKLYQLQSICDCGERAKYNARFINGEFTMTGEGVLIDGSSESVEYRQVCGKCFYKLIERNKKM